VQRLTVKEYPTTIVNWYFTIEIVSRTALVGNRLPVINEQPACPEQDVSLGTEYRSTFVVTDPDGDEIELYIEFDNPVAKTCKICFS